MKANQKKTREESKISPDPESVDYTFAQAQDTARDMGILVKIIGEEKLAWSLTGAKLAIAAYYPQLHFHCVNAAAGFGFVKKIPTLLVNKTAWFVLECSQHLSLLKMVFDNQILSVQIFDSTGITPKTFQSKTDAQYCAEHYDLIKTVGDTVGAQNYRVECVKQKRQVDFTNCFSFVLSDLQTALKLSEQNIPLYRSSEGVIETVGKMQVIVHKYFHNDFYKLTQSRSFLPPDVSQPWIGTINHEADLVSIRSLALLLEKKIIPNKTPNVNVTQNHQSSNLASSIGHFANKSLKAEANSTKDLQESLYSISSMDGSSKQSELTKILGEIDTHALMQVFKDCGLNIDSIEITSEQIKIPLNQIKNISLLEKELPSIKTRTQRIFNPIIEGHSAIINLNTYSFKMRPPGYGDV